MATGGASDIERGTDETFDNLCSPCSRRNKNTEGSKFCTDCEKYFCSICVDWHNDFPALIDHKILDEASFSFMQVKNRKKYSVREKSDTDIGCSIRSICELDDGTIILSDSNHNKLKRLDSSYMVRDSCKFPSRPYQVCIISSQEVAVCCGYSCLIQFVSIETTMQKTRQIKTDFYCTGIAYNDEKLFISDRWQSVYVYTLTGERLQQLKYSQLEPSFLERILGDICVMNIAMSTDGSTIYIPHSRKGLIIMNSNGQLVGEFTDPKLTGATGVCLYNNSVLVCGEYSTTVLQFSPDGKMIGKVLNRDYGCRALCYCKKTSKLIIGCFDEIEVYDTRVLWSEHDKQ